MQMNMLEAKTKLSQLVAAALRGEEVLIARNGVPIVQIVPAPVHKKTMPFGFLEGRSPIADSLLFGMSDEEADHFLKEGIRQSVELLLDTHILIWMATDPDRIPPKLLAAIADADVRYVSIITALEIQLKNLRHPDIFSFSNTDLEIVMEKFSCTQLPLTFQDVRTLQQMDFIHNDPFDRLLMCQATNRGVYLATVDQMIVETFDRWKAFYLFSTERHEG